MSFSPHQFIAYFRPARFSSFGVPAGNRTQWGQTLFEFQYISKPKVVWTSGDPTQWSDLLVPTNLLLISDPPDSVRLVSQPATGTQWCQTHSEINSNSS